MPEFSASLPDFTRWPSFPFEGDMRVKRLADPVDVEPPRSGEDAADCVACNTPDDAYIWVSERWRVRAMDRPTGLPMVLILECRSHLDLGDLPNLLAAELGVMTVRLERAIRSLDGVARVHVNRWGDGSAHLHMWFLARPYGRLQLRGTFLSLWDDILPVIPEEQWRGNLALVAAWLAEFGGRAIAEPPHIHWQSPSTFSNDVTLSAATPTDDSVADPERDQPAPADEALSNMATADRAVGDVATANGAMTAAVAAGGDGTDRGSDHAGDDATAVPAVADEDAADAGTATSEADDKTARLRSFDDGETRDLTAYAKSVDRDGRNDGTKNQPSGVAQDAGGADAEIPAQQGPEQTADAETPSPASGPSSRQG